MGMLENLEHMLANGQDNLLLRYGLANEYFKASRYDDAVAQARAALGHDAKYSAAWKLLGRALAEAGQQVAAIAAYEEGIAVAEQNGDMQAGKEMRVFLKRLQR